MIVEILAVLGAWLAGGLFMVAAGGRGPILIPLSLVVGFCVQIVVTTGLTIGRLPTHPAVVIALALLAGCAAQAVAWRSGRVEAPGIVGIVTAGAALSSFVALQRLVHVVVIYPDSYSYAAVGSLLYRDETGIASAYLLQTRQVGFSSLHSAANALGADYLHSIGPLLGICILWVLGWLIVQGLQASFTPRSCATLVSAGAVLLVATNPAFPLSLWLLGAHALAAVLLLVLSGGAWLLSISRREVPGVFLAMAMAATTLPLVRVEGFIVAILALLPIVAGDRISLVRRVVLAACIGSSTLVWHVFLWSWYLRTGLDVPTSVLGGAAAGAGVLVVAIVATVVPRVTTAVPMWVFEVAMLAGLALAFVFFGDYLIPSLEATVENLVFDAGGWGMSLVILGLVAITVGSLTTARRSAILRFPLTSFFPAALAMAVLRDLPYRVGYQDSLNRMMMHILPLLVLFIASAAGSSFTRLGPDAAAHPRSASQP